MSVDASGMRSRISSMHACMLDGRLVWYPQQRHGVCGRNHSRCKVGGREVWRAAHYLLRADERVSMWQDGDGCACRAVVGCVWLGSRLLGVCLCGCVQSTRGSAGEDAGGCTLHG